MPGLNSRIDNRDADASTVKGVGRPAVDDWLRTHGGSTGDIFNVPGDGERAVRRNVIDEAAGREGIESVERQVDDERFGSADAVCNASLSVRHQGSKNGVIGVISILHENMDIPARLKEDDGQNHEA